MSKDIMPKSIRVNFWCNAGYTEEIVEVKLYEDNGTIESQIQQAFEHWLDNNEDVGWDIVTDEDDELSDYPEEGYIDFD